MKFPDKSTSVAIVTRVFTAIAATLLITSPCDSALPMASPGATDPLSIRPSTELLSAISERLAAGETVRMNMAVILVDFSDKPANRNAHTPDYYRQLFFSRGVMPTGSVAEYYLENSGGRFILDGQVAGWYRMSQVLQNYTFSQFGLGAFPRNSQGLAREAIRAADADLNFALFDSDGPDGVSDTIDDDERVDLIMIVHAGEGGETSASANTFRSIAWWLPGDEPVDGVNAFNFALGPEEGGIGIFAHEMGHLLGLEDLYDAGGDSGGLGVWSLMSFGWSLNQTRTPAHMDAWSKELLGFAPVVNVTGNPTDIVIDPVETGGTIYRLAASGVSEYFLVENRQKIGFDAQIPGEGILIYHVDLRQPSNNLAGFYLVGLEQADGFFDLERFLGRANSGDAGDPYTATTPSEGFGRFTSPASRTNLGADTGVTVYHIRGPDAGRRMTVDFRTASGPSIRIESLGSQPLTGNGDRFIEAGETFQVVPRLIVEGGTAHDVRLTLISEDPLAEVLNASLPVGDLAAGEHNVPGLVASAAATIPSNPYALAVRLEAEYREEVKLSTPLSVAVGSVEGLHADFESGDGGFTHAPTRLARFDTWFPDPNPGNGTTRAWRSGYPTGGFRDRIDAALVTPFFIIPPDGHLLFDHFVDVPTDPTNGISAGGFIEISVNGGPWTQITPVDGYDIQYFSTDLQLTGRRIFTGVHETEEWHTSTLDLSAWTGGAQVRFRFFSERFILTGLGWAIDNVRAQSGDTPVRLLEFSAAREASGVRLHWRLAADEILAAVRLSRSAGPGDPFVPLESRPASESGDYLDVAAGPEACTYRLSALRRDGTSLELGTIEAAGAGSAGAPRLDITPNPIRNAAIVSFRLPRPGPVQLVLFDALGRKIRDLVDRTLEAGDHQLQWDGTTAGGEPVGRGVYFYRLTGPGVAETRKIVVAR